MEEQAEKPGKILYDGMHKALDEVSADLAKLLTDPKQWTGANVQKMFAQTFDGLARSIVESSLKASMQTGLGKLGGWMQGQGGILGKIGGAISPKVKADGSTQDKALWVRHAEKDSLPGQSKPDGSQTNPFYVIIENPVGSQESPGTPGASGKSVLPGILGAGGYLGKILGSFGGGAGGVAGGAAGSATESATSTITYDMSSLGDTAGSYGRWRPCLGWDGL